MCEQKRSVNISGKIMRLDSPRLMGILNITPDSFYDGGKYNSIHAVMAEADKMIQEGAEIIDIGAQSSRPGAEILPVKEEWQRLEPVLREFRQAYPDFPLSIDSFYAEVAKQSVNKYHADIINDISAGGMDAGMIPCIAELNLPYVIMHMKGTPKNMQNNPKYEDILHEIIGFFHQKIHFLREKGIHDIIIDPGFGFGKSVEDNYLLLNKLDSFRIFNLPVMAGLSRKSMISKLLGTTPEENLNGSTVLHTIALMKGASILRVHDVKEAKEAVLLVEKAIKNTSDKW